MNSLPLLKNRLPNASTSGLVPTGVSMGRYDGDEKATELHFNEARGEINWMRRVTCRSLGAMENMMPIYCPEV